VLVVVIAAVIAWPLRAFVMQPFWINGASMAPQLSVNDRVIVSKLAYDLHDPKRGDVIVFDAPPGQPELVDTGGPIGFIRRLVQPPTEYVKRVVGLPGEFIQTKDGRIYVDGRLLVEPYLPPGTRTEDFEPVEVPEGHLFVLGDNRSESQDSRVFGPIPRSAVVGRAILRVWPVQRASFL
jgi:signal peptidase I